MQLLVDDVLKAIYVIVADFLSKWETSLFVVCLQEKLISFNCLRSKIC